jgi:hypothetical protein
MSVAAKVERLYLTISISTRLFRSQKNLCFTPEQVGRSYRGFTRILFVSVMVSGRPDPTSGCNPTTRLGFRVGPTISRRVRVRVDSSDPTDPTTRQPDNPTEFKHENDQPIKKKLTKISKKCLELLVFNKNLQFWATIRKISLRKIGF